jgi:hypothetical protein
MNIGVLVLTKRRVRTISNESGCMAAAIKRDRRAVDKFNNHVWIYCSRPHTTSSNARRLLFDYEYQPQYDRELIEQQWRGQQRGAGGI